MNLIELQRCLRQLRLGGIAAVLETRLRQAQAETMPPIDLLSCLAHDELTRRSDRNRVFDEEDAPEKHFGFIIDYTGVLKDLGDAFASYDALQGFTEEDIAQIIVAIRHEANKRVNSLLRCSNP